MAPPAAAAGLAATIGLILVGRLLRQPIDGYGVGGSEYNEHWQRLVWAERVGEHLSERGLDGLVAAMDADFPPGLYAWGEAAGLLVGRSADGIALAGLAWLFVLAVAVGLTAEALADRRAGMAACVGTLLLPAAHGSAFRYYFDLPMTALAWCAVAALAAGGARSRAWGLLVGLAALAATAFKWTAIPLLAPLLLGVALEPAAPGARRRRLVALAIAGALWGAGVAAWTAASPDGSLEAMAEEAHLTDSDPSLASGVAQTLLDPAWERRIPARIAWYGLSGLGSIVSPLLALAALPLLLAWLTSQRRGSRLTAVGLLGTAAFLLLLVRPIDERFALTLAPVLPLLAGLGWSALPATRRRLWGTAAVVAGLLVALDFHHLPATPATAAFTPQPWSRSVEPDPDNVLPAVRFRGVGAASSWERRGWGRLDEAPPHRRLLRRALLEELDRCPPARIEQQEFAPVVSERGDLVWLSYAFALRERRGELTDWYGTGTCRTDGETPPGLLVLATAGDGAAACVTSPPLRRWRSVQDPDGGPGIDLLTPGGVSPCGSEAGP